jgi:hypothetical protein
MRLKLLLHFIYADSLTLNADFYIDSCNYHAITERILFWMVFPRKNEFCLTLLYRKAIFIKAVKRNVKNLDSVGNYPENPDSSNEYVHN